MPDIDTDRLLCIVTGVQLKAELGDRPLAYRVEQEARRLLKELLPPPTTRCRCSRQSSSATSTTSTTTNSKAAR